jgi:hypothetical protein
MSSCSWNQVSGGHRCPVSDHQGLPVTARLGTQRVRRPLRPELAAPLGVWPSSQLTRCAGGRAGWRLSGDVAVLCCCTAPAPSAKTPAAVLAGRPSAFRPDTQRLCPAAPGICPVTACIFQGMAPYPGQARCLALGFWPECFRRLNVKGGRRSFPKETRSALDIEGKHVTIQGPSPGLSPAAALAPSARATWLPSLLSRSFVCRHPGPFRSVRDLGLVPARCSGGSGISKSRSSWWLPASEGLPDRFACRGPSARRGGRQVAASQCGCCAPPLTAAGSRWLLLLLSRLLSAL